MKNALILWMALSACNERGFHNNSETLSQQSGSQWILSGFLPETPNQRIYLHIKGAEIYKVTQEIPVISSNTIILNTESWIFPGLMDLHSHVKYNILPLWSDAKGQFLNRFEWRTVYPDYKNAVSFNMTPIKGNTVCAAVRYAEIKAMTGGATAIQGIGTETKCAENFGIRNLEIANEFKNKVKIRSMTDLIMPGLLKGVYKTNIEKLMAQNNYDYDKAYVEFLRTSGVAEWITTFTNAENTLENGLRLMLGKTINDFQLTLPIQQQPPSLNDIKSIKLRKNSAEFTLEQFLTQEPYKLKNTDVAKQLPLMTKWLQEYTQLSAATRTENKAYDFLGKGGVLSIPSSTRRYINMFERSVRQSLLKYFNEQNGIAAFAHLSEGMRKDKYNQQEYDYVKTFGLNKPGLVLIHGVGMSRSQMLDAAQNQISLVWSPFSNLLLYGETLDVQTALEVGINVAIGADWTPTGSKHILDELKIARNYLDKENIGVSDKMLVDMVTVNAAKAMRRSDVVGQVKPGFLADLTLVKRQNINQPYRDLIQANQEDITLVVIGGRPSYGDTNNMNTIVRKIEPNAILETLKPMGCSFEKSLWLNYRTRFDLANPGYQSIVDISSELDAKMNAYAEEVKTKTPSKVKHLVKRDRLFNCEDENYQRRLNSFIAEEWHANSRTRPQRRGEANNLRGLSDQWSPLEGPSEISEFDPEDPEEEM